MANKLNAELDLLVDGEGFSGLQVGMVKVFQSAFTAISKPDSVNGDLKAARAASGLRALIPPGKITELEDKPEGRQELLALFQDLWHGLINIATRIPYHHCWSQNLLVKTLQVLKNDSSMWKDLPDLSATMRDKWIDPTFEWHPDEEETYTLGQWLNLNSFAARLFGSGVFISNRPPIWQLRQALEDDLAEAKGDCTPAEAVDNRIAVASEWLIHSGPALHKQCLLESQDLDDALRRSYRAGTHFSGHSGFNIERWGFWGRRLGELRPTAGGHIASKVSQAIESMSAATAGIAGNQQ
ncbi:hypothetical protein OQA88_11883 [Cercophora sp. LCS_1]